MLQPYATHKNIDAEALLAFAVSRDESIKTRKISQVRLTQSSVASRSFMIDDNTTVQPLDAVAKYLGAPKSFLQTCDMNLAQHIVDHQFNKVRDKKELVFREHVAVGSRVIDSPRIYGQQIVEKLIAGVGEVRNSNFYDLGDYIDTTLAGDKVVMESKAKVGDITEGGIRCRYSELLTRAPSIEPYVERLVCTNGMIISDRLSVFDFEDMDQFIKQLEGSITKAMQFVDSSIRLQLQKANDTPVERGEQAIRHIFTERRLNPRLLSPAIAALALEDDGTAFGVLQAITRAANDMPYAHRALLQETGAKEMARLETMHCPTCWSSLSH
jgi:hypothetical protein